MDNGGKVLRVLFLEDSEQDIEIVGQMLRDGLGCEVAFDSARTGKEYLQCLESGGYDVILADHTLPGFDAFGALEHARRLCPKTPFICVSGTIGEDNAVELLKQGATDYVLKDRLSRLCFAVERALESARRDAQRGRAETEIAEAKARHEEAERIAHIGSWDWDHRTGAIIWSHEMYRIFSVDRSSIHLSHGAASAFVHPDDRELVDQTIGDAIRNRAPYTVEHRLILPDGRIRYVRAQGKITFDAGGNPVYRIGTMQDITELKLAEMETNRARKSLEEAQRVAHIGSFEFDIPENKIYWSDETYRILGFDPQTTKLYPNIMYDHMSRDDTRKVNETIAAAVSEKAHHYIVEYEFACTRGKKISLCTRGYIQYGPDGRPACVTGTIQDVTDRKRAEEAERKRIEAETRMGVLTEFFINVSSN